MMFQFQRRLKISPKFHYEELVNEFAYIFQVFYRIIWYGKLEISSSEPHPAHTSHISSRMCEILSANFATLQRLYRVVWTSEQSRKSTLDPISYVAQQ